MSLLLISKSYFGESDSEYGGEEDEFEEGEKSVDSSESIVERFMKSKWDDEDEETDSNVKSCSSPPDKEPEGRPLENPSSGSFSTSDVPLDVLNVKQPEAASVIQSDKPQLTSVSSSPRIELSLGEIADNTRKPHQSCRPQKKRGMTSKRISPNQFKSSSSKPAAELRVQTLYKCPYCLLIFAVADDLIQHLQCHAMNKSTVFNTGNADSSKNSAIRLIKTREKLRNPAKNRKVLTVKSPKNSILKLAKEGNILHPCEIKLTRCDHLISDWKPLNTKTKKIALHKNCLAEIRGVTKRRSAGIHARRKMKQMLEEEDDECGKQTDSQVPDKPMNQLKNSIPLESKESPNLRHHVEEPTSDPGNSVKRFSMKEKPYKCETCFKCFSRQEYLKQHIRIHTDKKPYACSTCSKEFRSSKQLKRHIRTHTSEKTYKCPTCSKGFGDSSNLKTHIRTHTGEKPYKCSICSKGFRDSYSLKVHIQTHTKEKPYQCFTCSKGFGSLSNLKTHIRIHTGEKPYECPTCFKGFLNSSNLITHFRIHTQEKPYKCPTCSKGFRNSEHLKYHIRTHTGEKPYKCPTCLKGFVNSSNLKTHIRTHTGEKPYKCPTCLKGFVNSSNLKSHIRTHTGDKHTSRF